MMNDYEMKAYEEVQDWRLKIMKRSGMFNKLSKKAQNKMNSYIPEKVHQMITDKMNFIISVICYADPACSCKRTYTTTCCDGIAVNRYYEIH